MDGVPMGAAGSNCAETLLALLAPWRKEMEREAKSDEAQRQLADKGFVILGQKASATLRRAMRQFFWAADKLKKGSSKFVQGRQRWLLPLGFQSLYAKIMHGVMATLFPQLAKLKKVRVHVELLESDSSILDQQPLHIDFPEDGCAAIVQCSTTKAVELVSGSHKTDITAYKLLQIHLLLGQVLVFHSGLFHAGLTTATPRTALYYSIQVPFATAAERTAAAKFYVERKEMIKESLPAHVKKVGVTSFGQSLYGTREEPLAAAGARAFMCLNPPSLSWTQDDKLNS
jgi:hypothetical protein